jgi:hypothetical protein
MHASPGEPRLRSWQTPVRAEPPSEIGSEPRGIDGHGAFGGFLQRIDLSNDLGLAIGERIRGVRRAGAARTSGATNCVD